MNTEQKERERAKRRVSDNLSKNESCISCWIRENPPTLLTKADAHSHLHFKPTRTIQNDLPRVQQQNALQLRDGEAQLKNESQRVKATTDEEGFFFSKFKKQWKECKKKKKKQKHPSSLTSTRVGKKYLNKFLTAGASWLLLLKSYGSRRW